MIPLPRISERLVAQPNRIAHLSHIGGYSATNRLPEQVIFHIDEAWEEMILPVPAHAYQEGVGPGEPLLMEEQLVEINEAAARGDLEVVTRLVQTGVDVDSIDQYGETPLHRAAWEGHDEIVKFLLNNGADVNARTGYGKTPLHRAAWRGHLHVIRFLLENGAEPQSTNQEGRHPFALCGKARA
jgi:hypothetical protein